MIDAEKVKSQVIRDEKDPKITRKVAEHAGYESIGVNGRVSIEVIKSKIQRDPELRRRLEKLFWKAVEARIRGTLDALERGDTGAAGTYVEGGRVVVQAAAKSGRRLLFVQAKHLLRLGWQQRLAVREVWAAWCPRREAIRRIMLKG